MCLITMTKEPFIAEEDFTVYKEMKPRYGKSVKDKGLLSPYYDHWYEFGKTYSVDMKIEDVDYDLPSPFFFDEISFADYNELKNEEWDERCEIYSVSCGFHAALTKTRFEDSVFYAMPELIVECTIPKGSEYYTDRTGLIVSNRIIVNKIS